MTPAEFRAYRAGVEDALALVTAAADSLRQSSKMLRLRRELAIAVLTAVAEEGRALIDRALETEKAAASKCLQKTSGGFAEIATKPLPRNCCPTVLSARA